MNKLLNFEQGKPMKISDLKLHTGDISIAGNPNLMRDHVVKIHTTPFLIYSTLKETFGPPNSLNFDDDKTQWEWTFFYGDHFVEIYDWKMDSTSIAVYCNPPNVEKSQLVAESIKGILEKAALKSKSKIKDRINQSTHRILENPFIAYYSTAKSLVDTASSIAEVHTKIAMAKFHDAFDGGHLEESGLLNGIDIPDSSSELYRSAFLMYLASFEGFLNVLYELYLFPDLRTDRLSERIAREQIDVKLRMAPIYCEGFKVKTLDGNDPRFKNLMKLINLRNNYVHANLVKTFERHLIQEDGYTFILEHEDAEDIPTNINRLEQRHVIHAQSCIDQAVEFVLESMKPKAKREFSQVIYEEDIEIEEEDGEMILVI